MNRRNEDGKLAHHTRFWMNLTFTVATGLIIMESYRNTLDALMFLFYLAVVGGSPVAIKLIEMYFAWKTAALPK